MKVLFVSRWGVQCGIATYTQQLVEALSRFEIKCVCAAQKKGGMPLVDAPKDIPVSFCWTEKEESLEGVFHLINKEKPDIIHMQHEFGLFHNPRAVMGFFNEMKRQRKKIVITCHTIVEPPSHFAWFFLDPIKVCNRIICHMESAIPVLRKWKITGNKIALIPHGTKEECYKKEKMEARHRLFLPQDEDLIVALSLGFITSGKMQHEGIRAIIDLVHEGLIDPLKFLYVIAGIPGLNHPENVKYCNELHQLVTENRAWNYIRIVPRFIQDEDLPDWYGAADFMITGSHPTCYSISGRSHQEMAFGMPTVSANELILSDFNEYRSLKYQQLKGLKIGIMRLINERSLRESLSYRCMQFAEQTSWTNVAKQHISLYKDVISGA